MGKVKEEFENRVNEIELYYNFINATIGSTKRIKKEVVQNQDLHKILKANMFLILYNLIEFTIKRIIEEISNEISNEKVFFNDVIPEIKKLWIEKKYKNFKLVLKQGEKIEEEILKIIENIKSDIIDLNLKNKELNKNKTNSLYDFDGTMNLDKISKITNSFGMQSLKIDKEKSAILFKISNHRNDLSHGIQTFADCGGEYELSKIRDFKESTINVLRKIILNVENAIKNKYYKIPS